MPEYTFYLDVWLMRLGCNFLFEYLLLWATANVTRTSAKPARLTLAALLGTLHYLLYLLANFGLIPFYGLLRFLPIIVLLSLAMMAIAFYPLPPKRLSLVCAHFYAIGFLAAGAGMGTAYLLGNPQEPRFTPGILVAILTILVVAELGWGVVHKRMLHRVYRIPLEIHCEQQVIQVQALVDTGNNLRDPLNQQPVIIVEQKALLKILPPALNEIIADLQEGKLSATDRLANLNQWQTRLRVIPFSSIGKKSGLLVGFRPDRIRVGSDFIPPTSNPTIAIHPYSLDPNGEYAALIPPLLVENALGWADQSSAEGGKSHGTKSTHRL